MAETRDIIKAVKTGNIERVRELLDAEPELANARETDGATPLHYAAWKGLPGITKLLLERGADVKLESTNTHWGGTPLHAAAHANEKAVAEILIEAGADITTCSANGRTPLLETTLHNAAAVGRLLRANGALE